MYFDEYNVHKKQDKKTHKQKGKERKFESINSSLRSHVLPALGKLSCTSQKF